VPVNLTWPDIVIVGMTGIAALKGWKRGFVSELAGVVALAAAFIAAFRYNGFADRTVDGIAHVGPGSGHVIGMVVAGLIAYVVVAAIAYVLNRFAGLPIIETGNAMAGSIVGAAKGLAILWAILYIALFFPLSRDLRVDLHRSSMVVFLESQNEPIDQTVRSTLPWFVKPFSQPMFARHHV
jgi:uncharacterized membrane protein required for colicin V production